MNTTIKFKKLYKDSMIPTRGSEDSAGYDLYAYIEGDGMLEIKPFETVLIGTGIAITPPIGTFGAIFARSGLATKSGIAPANKVGVCDIDYTGEYKVALHNHSSKAAYVHHGDRIAQLVFIPYVIGNFIEVNKLDKTQRGNNGFGSTGNK